MPLSRKAPAKLRGLALGQGGQVDRLRRQEQAGALRLGQRREVVEEPGEPHGLVVHRGEVGRLVREHAVLGGLDAPQEAVHRRAQLVRQVGHALLAQLLLVLQRLRQAVEGPGDGADLVVAAHLDAGVEPAGAHRLGAGPDLAQRAREA